MPRLAAAMIIRLSLENEILPDPIHSGRGMAVAAQTAAKTALENAADALAARVVPALVK
jgi:hypothetical protein